MSSSRALFTSAATSNVSESGCSISLEFQRRIIIQSGDWFKSSTMTLGSYYSPILKHITFIVQNICSCYNITQQEAGRVKKGPLSSLYNQSQKSQDTSAYILLAKTQSGGQLTSKGGSEMWAVFIQLKFQCLSTKQVNTYGVIQFLSQRCNQFLFQIIYSQVFLELLCTTHCGS